MFWGRNPPVAPHKKDKWQKVKLHISSTLPPSVIHSKAGVFRSAGGQTCAANGAMKKIDEITDRLVSADGLNFNIFRYNIGGGDSKHCICKVI